MKLNKKGYMLVEIVIASVLAMGIAYYLLNLTYKFKNTNEDIYQSYFYMKDKVLITKNIMSDLEKITKIKYVENKEDKLVWMLIDGYIEDAPVQRKLVLNKRNKPATIEYGAFNVDHTFDVSDISHYKFDTSNVSYYKKEFSPALIVGELGVSYNGDLMITIPVKSIYDDNDYSIKLFGKGLG